MRTRAAESSSRQAVSLTQSWQRGASRAPNGAGQLRVTVAGRQPAAAAVASQTGASNGVGRPEASASQTLQADQLAELAKFRALPVTVQRSLFEYDSQVASLFRSYACGISASECVETLMGGAPEYLLTVDNPTYRDSPLGKALLKQNQHASRFLIGLASRGPQKQAVLSHRNSAGHTLLMLAVDFDSKDCQDILVSLLEAFPAQIYRFYDSQGRNALHWCTAEKYATSFRIILEAVLKMDESVEISKQSIKEALDMTDRSQKTPIHYMAEAGDMEMFNVLDSFARSKSVRVDYDARFLTSDSKTPLMVAVASNHYDVCKWLLEKGGADVSQKQPVSCFTALHFAVRLGYCELIALLRSHGADVNFYDEECERLDDFKTPLEIAQTEAIPNQRQCIEYLTCDRSSLVQKYAYTVDSMPRRSLGTAAAAFVSLSASPALVAGPAFPEHERKPEASGPAAFFSDKKIVKDLQLFGSEQREELSRRLAELSKSEQFVKRLVEYVPDLEADLDYIRSCGDPVFSAIALLSDSDHASRFVIKQVLLDIEAGDLVELVIPATTS